MHKSIFFILVVACLTAACGSSGTPPAELVYSAQTAYYALNVAIATNSATLTGTGPFTFKVAPTLPAGLTLNATTGAVTGTPTTAAAASTFVVTASNASGDTTDGLVIGVEAVPVLAYASHSATFIVPGTTMAPIVPTAATGTGTLAFEAMNLPTGWAIDSNGAISGPIDAFGATATVQIFLHDNTHQQTEWDLQLATTATVSGTTHTITVTDNQASSVNSTITVSDPDGGDVLVGDSVAWVYSSSTPVTDNVTLSVEGQPIEGNPGTTLIGSIGINSTGLVPFSVSDIASTTMGSFTVD